MRSHYLIVSLLLTAAGVAPGCSTEPKADRTFHTSGSRPADQRAEQRVTKVEQMRGEKAAAAEAGELRSLYDRLGGDQGLRAIVTDFVDRVVADPRANWERKGVEHGGVLGIGSKSSEWKPTAQNKATLVDHFVQFLAVTTGGPSDYAGGNIKTVHAGMKVTNTEFDASVGAMKASLDALGVGTAEQKELLAVLESTRSQIVEER